MIAEWIDHDTIRAPYRHPERAPARGSRHLHPEDDRWPAWEQWLFEHGQLRPAYDDHRRTSR